jgi:multiple RNA-binding domain-containing protein 1
MSRICIKNLSKSATEKQLQELFGQKGEVTDVKVLKTKGGQVRRMAFVGYRTEAQAQEAQRYFHNTFMGLSRIAVEIAKKYEKRADALRVIKSNHSVAYDDDDEAAREPSSTTKTSPTGSPSVLKTSKSEVIIGKKKAEFIALMRNRSNTSRWTNDDGQAPILDPDLSTDEHASDIEDDDDDVNYKLVTNKGAAASTQDGDGSEHARPLSDMDYLRSKVRRHSSSQSDSEADDEHDEHDATNKEVSGAADEEKGSQPYRVIPEEGSMDEDTTRLFVKNLPFSCSEEEFRSLLEPFGPVEVHLPLDADKRGKGFGFAEYMLPDHAALACAQLSGEAFQGRVLHVTKANRRIEKVVEVAGTSSQLSAQKTSKLSSFQQKKEEERRKFLSRKEGWNASFVRSDTVVDALANR